MASRGSERTIALTKLIPASSSSAAILSPHFPSPSPKERSRKSNAGRSSLTSRTVTERKPLPCVSKRPAYRYLLLTAQFAQSPLSPRQRPYGRQKRTSQLRQERSFAE